MTIYKIACLAGDGIGPEVMEAAKLVLSAVAQKHNFQIEYSQALIGGAAFEKCGEHLPAATLDVARASQAILFGSVGGPLTEQHLPKWKNCETTALLGLRKAFNFGANYRPAVVYPQLAHICPLKPELIKAGLDLLIIRELLGDIYFGEKKFYTENNLRAASDLCTYREDQIAFVLHAAFKAARSRKQKVTSVDKANVLNTSKLWREVATEISREYSDVKFENMLVDNCAMQIIKNPAQFDVIVTSNMFGDILSDAAAVLPGSLGLTPSASIDPQGFGMYEPSGGSAPDIAGKNIANPTAQILSAAMLLKFSFGLVAAAKNIELAIAKTFEQAVFTGDICPIGAKPATTMEFTQSVLRNL